MLPTKCILYSIDWYCNGMTAIHLFFVAESITDLYSEFSQCSVI